MDDDDIVRRALAGRPLQVNAHEVLQELRPSMRRAQTNRRIATFAAAAIIVSGGGAAALTITGGPDAPTLRTLPTAEIDAADTSVSTSVAPASTSSSPHPSTTEVAEPPPPPAEPSVVEPLNPPSVSRVPSTPPPAPAPPPEPEPEPDPAPEPTPAAATPTTITSLCGQVAVTIEGGRVSIASVSALAGFEASIGTDGPTSVEVAFRGDAGTCEIHAELEQGVLDVEVQNPDRDD